MPCLLGCGSNRFVRLCFDFGPSSLTLILYRTRSYVVFVGVVPPFITHLIECMLLTIFIIMLYTRALFAVIIVCAQACCKAVGRKFQVVLSSAARMTLDRRGVWVPPTGFFLISPCFRCHLSDFLNTKYFQSESCNSI